ncbi:uncharacterized protein LOC114527600 [Dendronephthya gigantea]|uniref:uncharacterized protein LOC114527600 n=1 Tax=Dendronephthya gigantea TaxID=151771 RepID=UPI00106D514F|nr:uncharacterized protein LOC114527600 [Dendronephthya gigantea]
MAAQEAQIPAENVEAAQAILATDHPPAAAVEIDQPQPPVVAGQDAPPRPQLPTENAQLPEDMSLETLRQRIKILEDSQGTTVEALLRQITNYGSRRVEDFDKYQALHLAENLVSVAKTSGDLKAASYEIIATTLRDKLSVEVEHFKAYFLALLADKEFSRIIDTVSKIDKSFQRSSPYQRSSHARRGRFTSGNPAPRIVCYKCGTPGHKSPQCWRRPSNRLPPRQDRPQQNPPMR